MNRRAVFALLVIVALSTFALISLASAAPKPNAHRPTHAEVVAYWTPERVARAIPRDLVVDASGKVVANKGKPGGGGGGGGTGTTAVTGASWTGGGSVLDATGKVYFTLGGINYVCSGTVVNDGNTHVSVVLTAAHCTYDEQENAFATNFMFVSNYDDGGTFVGCGNAENEQCWTASGLVTTKLWADSTSSTINWGGDWAFAVMQPNSRGSLDQYVTGYPLGAAAPSTSVHAFGYPAAKKYSGSDLVYCAGATIQDPYQPSTNWGLACDMTGGSSGGPWIADFGSAGTLVAVNSYGYRGGPYSGYMFGPLFGPYTAKTLTQALASSGNMLVAP